MMTSTESLRNRREGSCSNPVRCSSPPVEFEFASMLSKFVRGDPKLDKLSAKAEEKFKCVYYASSECSLSQSLKQIRHELPKIIDEKLPSVAATIGKLMEVLTYSIMVVCERIGIAGDSLKKQLSKLGLKIAEVIKKLKQQSSSDAIRKLIEEDLLTVMKEICSIVNNITSPPPQSSHKRAASFVGNSLIFKLIDADVLIMLNFYEPVIDYVVKFLSILIKVDPKLPFPIDLFQDLQEEFKKCKINLVEAKKFYEGDGVKKQARLRGWFGTAAWSALTALAALVLSGGNPAAAVIAVAACGVPGGLYTEYKVWNIPRTVESYKESKKEIVEILKEIPPESITKNL